MDKTKAVRANAAAPLVVSDDQFALIAAIEELAKAMEYLAGKM